MECAAGSETSSASRRSRLKGATILVVEDEVLVSEVTCEVLEQSGYRVFHADNAKDAMELFMLHRDEVDLLLCDAILPDQNGALLAQAMAAKAPRLKAIVCSGYPSSVIGKHFPRENDAHFMTKPYSAASLLGKVRRVLQAAE